MNNEQWLQRAVTQVGKRIWKSYENGIELDGVFFSVELAKSLRAGDKIVVVGEPGKLRFEKVTS